MKKTLTRTTEDLALYLQKLADDKVETSISWRCLNCGETHSCNLLEKVRSVKNEYLVGENKPDLSLFDLNGDLFAAIHFLKRKSIDTTMQEAYRGKCMYIQIKLETGDDFNSLSQKLQKPDFVAICVNPKCETCSHPMQKVILWIVDGCCWKCEGDMKVAAVEAGMSRGGSYVGPERFTLNEIEIARNKGVVIATHYSNTQRRSYLANSCPHCNAFVGDYYLFTEYISTTGYGDVDFEKIEAGYYCEPCTEPRFL
ncbi:hypothetical protein [Mucilaginibacter psychrotolerans]|uniref:Uncharacterized protein n=1 Tax=Mucilaginibacter psychrotolerans TaxID=1524096 RepID=A0A4Y8SH62_9SPHI|nr:hypothetical protein [Mucilaginibacter psychrotolerans]TFF37887.1 hypothetical protein E2R66_09865 [Mucilaginibacter psychrotolerans]